ncbi:Pept-C1 domain-containing protein [Aphelenchoides bicaudatus]|nr:Pept-C1 domain-containing protein [Aphelenchoides bicaudatus]
MSKFLIFLMALYGTSFCSKTDDFEELSGEQLIKFLETKPKLWESSPSDNSSRGLYSFGRKVDKIEFSFSNMSFGQHAKYSYDQYDDVELPKEFDSRKKWPYCKSIGNVWDQSSCWSCWAVSMVNVATDRLCIQTEGKVKVQLSAADLVSCCPECGVGEKRGGCSSGEPYKAWEHFRKLGLVSGGSYSSWSGCRPYPLKECNKGPETGYRYKCSYDHPPETPPCKRYCDYNHWRPYKEDKYYGDQIYYPRTVRAMQLEIMKRGPIQVIFDIYDDFESYKSGVYYHSWGKFVASHVVKVFGWGTEKGVPYWSGVNSWNIVKFLSILFNIL